MKNDTETLCVVRLSALAGRFPRRGVTEFFASFYNTLEQRPGLLLVKVDKTLYRRIAGYLELPTDRFLSKLLKTIEAETPQGKALYVSIQPEEC